MPCYHFVSVRSFARPVSIKNFASLSGLAKFSQLESPSRAAGNIWAKLGTHKKGQQSSLKLWPTPLRYSQNMLQKLEREIRNPPAKKHWKKFTHENRLQNSSKCVLVNFCTSCLDRLLIEYYNFKTFLYHVLKVFTPTLTSVHSHVYKYIVVSLSQDKIFEFPHFVWKKRSKKINNKTHSTQLDCLGIWNNID